MMKIPETNMNLVHDKGSISSQWINDGYNTIENLKKKIRLNIYLQ